MDARPWLGFCLLALLSSIAPATAQDLPEVDVDALMEQVNALGTQLRTEAQRLIDEEGAQKAIDRLRAEAEADETVAFRRMNLAAVVAVLAKDEERATILLTQIPAATDEELPAALGRHACIVQEGSDDLRGGSLSELIRQGAQPDAFERRLRRYAIILACLEQIAPASLDVAASLHYVGFTYQDRGDQDQALEYYRPSLAIYERLAPDSLDVGISLNNIGAVYKARGDLGQALEYYQRSLAIRERLAPDSLRVATSLNNIGGVYLERGDLDQALEHYQRSLAIFERLAPDFLEVATSLNNIGFVYHDRGDQDQALEYYQRSLAISERLAPDSLDVATSLNNIGTVHYNRSDLDQALAYHERSLAITERVAPESVACALFCSWLGWVAQDRGELSLAREWHERACSTLETAREQSSAETGARSEFAGQYAFMYHGLVRALLALNEVGAAIDTTERMRAQGFRQAMAERNLSADLDPAQAQRQEVVDTRRNRLYNELRGLEGEPPTQDRQQEITSELAALALEQEALEREMRQTNPEYAALAYPKPLTVGALADALDPGTVVLSYLVHKEVTRLFVFGPGLETQAHEIAVTSEELSERVQDTLSAVMARQPTASRAVLATVAGEEGEPGALLLELGRLLLEPAEQALQGTKRALILPDGPLWLLPFHALLLDEDTYLCDRLPVHYAPSATVFVEGRRFRQGATENRGMLAVGDPEFVNLQGEGRGAYVPIRAAFRATGTRDDAGGLRLASLPFTGAEVAAIEQSFAPDAETLKGAAATEPSARERAPGKRIVHFATHGLLDSASPSDSAVVLTIPQERSPDNDGFLKAWEVFGLDLEGCDLAALSACETAQGKLISGEGMVGLTRAFLYAGAASVLCTQWSVADQSTAALMVRFYEHYKAGDTKDVALQKAMREMCTGKQEDGSPLKLPAEIGEWREQWAHPYHWAPFILMGEYRQMGGA